MCKGEPGLARLGGRLLGRRGARCTVGMGRTGVTAWGQSRGSAAVRPWLGAIGARNLPRERPTPWPWGRRRAPAGPGRVGGGVGAPEGGRRVSLGRARSPVGGAGRLGDLGGRGQMHSSGNGNGTHNGAAQRDCGHVPGPASPKRRPRRRRYAARDMILTSSRPRSRHHVIKFSPVGADPLCGRLFPPRQTARAPHICRGI